MDGCKGREDSLLQKRQTKRRTTGYAKHTPNIGKMFDKILMLPFLNGFRC